MLKIHPKIFHVFSSSHLYIYILKLWSYFSMLIIFTNTGTRKMNMAKSCKIVSYINLPYSKDVPKSILIHKFQSLLLRSLTLPMPLNANCFSGNLPRGFWRGHVTGSNMIQGEFLWKHQLRWMILRSKRISRRWNGHLQSIRVDKAEVTAIPTKATFFTAIVFKWLRKYLKCGAKPCT